VAADVDINIGQTIVCDDHKILLAHFGKLSIGVRSVRLSLLVPLRQHALVVVVARRLPFALTFLFKGFSWREAACAHPCHVSYCETEFL
jgi:hypothetical protein